MVAHLVRNGNADGVVSVGKIAGELDIILNRFRIVIRRELF